MDKITIGDRLAGCGIGAFFGAVYGALLGGLVAWSGLAAWNAAYIKWTAVSFGVIGLVIGQFMGDLIGFILNFVLGVFSGFLSMEWRMLHEVDCPSSITGWLRVLFWLGVGTGIALYLGGRYE